MLISHSNTTPSTREAVKGNLSPLGNFSHAFHQYRLRSVPNIARSTPKVNAPPPSYRSCKPVHQSPNLRDLEKGGWLLCGRSKITRGSGRIEPQGEENTSLRLAFNYGAMKMDCTKRWIIGQYFARLNNIEGLNWKAFRTRHLGRA